MSEFVQCKVEGDGRHYHLAFAPYWVQGMPICEPKCFCKRKIVSYRHDAVEGSELLAQSSQWNRLTECPECRSWAESVDF